MADLRAAYLIHGDDHARVAERRAGLRALAERESATGIELHAGETATPEAVAAALHSMTFAMGRRFVLVEGVERWKDADVSAHLVPVLADMPAETTVAFFGREEGRHSVPATLVDAVKKAGGAVAAERTLKASELPRWLQGEAARAGVQLDTEAARALVGQVGDRRQRLLRELEKLAIELGPGARIGAEEVESAAAHSSERQVWGLVDALVARDRPGATRAFLALHAQGEAVARLVPLLARRMRDVLAIALRLEAGEAPRAIKSSIKGSPWAADRRIAEARAADVEGLRQAVEALADLELATRGDSELTEETAMLLAIARIAA